MESSKIKNTVIITLALLLLAAIGVIVWYLTSPPTSGADQGIVKLTPTPAGETAPDGIQIPGYARLEADSTTGELQVLFQNPEGNPCTFQIELILKDTGESVYKSPDIEPGFGVERPRLSKTPAPGAYAAVISYTTQSLEDKTPMNGASVETTLVVQ